MEDEPEDCRYCGGVGHDIQGGGYTPCPVCGGSGEEPKAETDENFDDILWEMMR
jgi:hypothetical protein